jgi:hypothetical protein
VSTAAAAAPVFISHADEDHATARQVCDFLEANSIPCWMAPRDIPPGKTWASAIVDAIESCRLLVLLVSGHSVLSRQVAREVQLADAAGVNVLAVRLQPVELTGDLEYFLSNTQWLEASSGPPENYLRSLVESIRSLLDSGRAKSQTSLDTRVPQTTSTIAAEFRNVVSIWFTTLAGGTKSVALAESWEGSTVFFAFRFLAYMLLTGALIRLPLSETGVQHPIGFIGAYLVSAVVEVAGAAAVLHWSLHRAGGTGDVRGSVVAVCLNIATFWPMLTVALAPVNTLIDPIIEGLRKGSPRDIDSQAWFAALSAIDILSIFACFIAATVMIWLLVRGLFQSLQIVHGISRRRALAGLIIAIPIYTVFLAVVSVPFAQVLHRYAQHA